MTKKWYVTLEKPYPDMWATVDCDELPIRVKQVATDVWDLHEMKVVKDKYGGTLGDTLTAEQLEYALSRTPIQVKQLNQLIKNIEFGSLYGAGPDKIKEMLTVNIKLDGVDEMKKAMEKMSATLTSDILKKSMQSMSESFQNIPKGFGKTAMQMQKDDMVDAMAYATQHLPYGKDETGSYAKSQSLSLPYGQELATYKGLKIVLSDMVEPDKIVMMQNAGTVVMGHAAYQELMGKINGGHL